MCRTVHAWNEQQAQSSLVRVKITDAELAKDIPSVPFIQAIASKRGHLRIGESPTATAIGIVFVDDPARVVEGRVGCKTHFL